MDAKNEVDLILAQWWEAQYKQRVRLRIIIPIGIVIFILSRLLSLEGCLPASIGVISLTWSLPMLRSMSQRSKRSLGAVLWIRRFHRGAQSLRLFGLWQAAVYPWGQLVTLSDERVKVSVIVRKSIVSSVLLWIVLAPFSETSFYNLPRDPDFNSLRGPERIGYLVGYISGGIFAKVAIGAALFFAWAYRSRSIVRSPGELDRILQHVRRIRSGRLFNLSGPGTIQCPRDDEKLWRSVILKLAPEVQGVIVDYGGGPSESIDWEVETLLRVCGPNKIILAIPEEAAVPVTTTSCEESLFLRLRGSLPMLQIITYPHRLPRSRLFRRYEDFIRPMQRAVGVVVTQAAGRS